LAAAQWRDLKSRKFAFPDARNALGSVRAAFCRIRDFNSFTLLESVMEMRRLGKTGLSVAPIVIGGNVFGWTADEKTSFAILDAFFDAGLTVRAFPPEGIRISVGEQESVDKLLEVAADLVRNLPNGHPGKRLG